MKPFKFLILSLAFLTCSGLNAQISYFGTSVKLDSCSNCMDPNYQFHGEITLGTENIISDMGARRLGTKYNWHGGTDYTDLNVNDHGFHIKATEAGRIIRVRASAGQKYPEIVGSQMHLMYNHMFTSALVPSGSVGLRQADVALVVLDRHNGGAGTDFRYGIIHYGTTDTVLIAACPQRNCANTYKLVGQDTIYAVDSVFVDQVIGSVGTSHKTKTTTSVPSHLHLQGFKSITPPSGCSHRYCRKNLINSLEFVEHQGPQYDILILKRQGADPYVYPEGFEISYPGSLPTKALVRPMMPDSILQNGILVPNNGHGSNVTYFNNTMNIDRTELLVRSLGAADFSVIKGGTLEAKVWMGFRENFDHHYPSHLLSTEGDWTNQGVFPLAYGARTINGVLRKGRWDDYYFTDFITRINKNDQIGGALELANCPLEARYTDSDYDLIARVTDVRGAEMNSAITDFHLDNFKPFVKGVNVTLDSVLLYDMEWVCESSCDGIKPTGGIAQTTIDTSLLSQPLNITVDASESLRFCDLQLQVNGISVPDNVITHLLPSSDRTQFRYKVNLPSNIIDSIASSENSRISLVIEGLDYPVIVGQLNSNSLLNLEDFYHPDSASLDTNCIQIPYRTGGGNSWSTVLPEGQELAHHFDLSCLSSGDNFSTNSRDTRLRMINGSCCSQELIDEIRNSSSVDINSPNCVCEGQSNAPFTVVVNDDLGPFTFEWTGPYGYYSELRTPTDISAAGDYILRITNESGCQVILTETIQSCPENGVIIFDVQPNCSSNGGNVFSTVIGGELPLHYEWSNGVVGSPNLHNVEAGSYILTVTDSGENNCPIIGAVEVPIPENPPFTILAEEIGHACNENDGYVVLDVSEIEEPYTIQWSLPGETEYRIGELSNGSYSVTVTDANGCSATESFIIHGAPSFNHFTFPETCESANDGRIELVANNNPASEEVTIEWSDGITNELIRTGLSAGFYSVTITGNESGCEVVKDSLSTHPTENSGEVPYLQSLRVLADYSGTEVLIYKGDWIESAAGCVEFQGGSQNLDQALVDAMGNGEVSWKVLAIYNQVVSTGSIVFTSQEGSLPPSFILETNDEHIIVLSANQVSTLIGMSGNFDLVIESFAENPVVGPTLNMFDYSGNLTNCVDIPRINSVTCQYEPPLDPAYIGNDPTHRFSFDCLEATMIGDVDNYTFCVNIGNVSVDSVQSVFWRGPDGNWFPSPNNDLCLQFPDDAFGEYCASVKVVLGTEACTVEVCGNYCAPPANWTIVEDITQPSCTSASDGAICLDIDPDNAPLLISWETGETESCLDNLTTGTYRYTLSPGGGCDLMRGFPYQDSIRLGIDNSAINVIENLTPSCSGGLGAGEACIYAYGGTPPYDIMWADGTVDNCIEQLVPGEYNYILTDACGATVEGVAVIEAIASNDIAVALPGPDDEACVSHLQFYLISPATVIVTITDNESGATFSQTILPTGNVPHLVLFEHISPGVYTVEILDLCRNTLQIFEEPVPDFDVHLISGIIHHDFIRCEGKTGMLTVVLAEDEGTPPYSILWSNGATTETIEDLEPGVVYSVTVTDANGCESTHGLTMSDRDVLTVAADITASCGVQGGNIDLTIEGGFRPYTFTWSNGQSSEDIEDLVAGQYCVTVTDSEDCSFTECFNVSQSDLEILGANIKDHECGVSEECNGSIDLIVNASEPVSYIWSNGATSQDILGLCGGEYHVTITSGGCVEIRSFQVGAGIIDNWNYEVEIIWNFGSEGFASDMGPARLNLVSEVFDQSFGHLTVASNPDLAFPIIDSVFVPQDTEVRVDIPYAYRFTETYYFSYTNAEDGCTYTGTFNRIPTCVFPDDNIDFEVQHQGNEQWACTSGLPHSYDVSLIDGASPPYFIRITMNSTTDPTHANYERVIEYPGSPFTIDSIPSGEVQFEVFNNCQHETITGALHNNCCIGFPCGLEETNELEITGLASQEFRFQYLSIYTIGVDDCYKNGESNVVITRPGALQSGSSEPTSWGVENLCWEGVIYVVVEGLGPPITIAQLTVEPHPSNDEFVRVSVNSDSDNNWFPPQAGSYTIRIGYVGTGNTELIDCEDEISVDFYGEGNWASFLNFRNDRDFYTHVADEHAEPYTMTYHCGSCPIHEEAISCPHCTSEGNYYLFGVDGHCDGPTTPGQFFRFIPESYSGNPCTSGGWVIYQGMDSNGNPAEKSVYVTPNTALDYNLSTLFPPWYIDNIPENHNMDCDFAGWCFFETEDIVGIPSPNGQPIAASYADLGSCEFVPDGAGGEPGSNEPVDDECPDGNCGDGYTCDANGNCIPTTDGCLNDVDCGEGYSCDPDTGECIENGPAEPCTNRFIQSYVGCGYDNPCTFTYDFGGPSVLRLEFFVHYYSAQLSVTVAGVSFSNSYTFSCLTASNQHGGDFDEYLIDIPSAGDVTITVSINNTCGEFDEPSFASWRAFCGEGFSPDEDQGSVLGEGEDNDSITLYPNPFSSDINLAFNNTGTPFNGIIRLVNGQGIEVMNRAYGFVEGENNVLLQDIDHLQAGVYTVLIFDEGGQLIGSANIVKM